MQTRLAYTLTLATAAIISSSIGIAVSEFSMPWMIFVFPFLALVTGGLTGWYIPAWLMSKTGHTKTWAALSGMACACVSMALCATSYAVFIMIADRAVHLSSDMLGVLLFCNMVTQIACGLFAYPMGALAGLVAYRLAENKKAPIEAMTAFE